MAFSGGGDEVPLARIEDEGHALALDWPGELPAPRLDGPSAVYPHVLPDVDLQVTATPESFKYVLVVKTPEAAASDELERLTFGLSTQNLTVREGAAGNLAAVDGNGNSVFKSPPAQMWDSAGQNATSETQPQLVTVQAADTAVDAQSEPSDPSESAPSGSGLEPGQGDTVARIDVEVAKDSLSVIPDTDMLTSTEESAFPVFIDPPVTWDESERTLLRSDGYESYGWGNGDDGLGKGAGKCGSWAGYYCGPGYVQKLYFEFSPDKLKGKKVLDATFRITEPWAFQCDPRWVDLVRTNNISSSTTWSSRPKELDWMGDRWVSAGRGSLCDPDSPDAPIEFNDNPEESNENLTPTVRNFAAGKFSRLTLEIRAHDESDTSAWKRFKNDAVLAVDFVGLPDKPTSVGLQGGGSSTKPVCVKQEDAPAIMSYPEPNLKATPQTKAGGEDKAQLRVYFDVDVQNADKTWTDATPPSTGSLSPSTGYVGDGQTVSMRWSWLTEGKLYRYHAWTWSYYNNGSHLSSEASDGFCYFKVDPTRPKAPTVTFGSGPYSECTTNDCVAGGGPGTPGSFSFKPAAGDTNTSYLYRLNSDDSWTKINGSAPSVDITPPRAGLYNLYVMARDTVGRIGAITVVDFLVDVGEKPVGWWKFEEDSGAAIDSATDKDDADNATLAGGAVRDEHGRRGVITRDSDDVPQAPVTDQALALDGTKGYAATDGQVLETRASYTISTWARLTQAPTHNSTVLSQDGEHRSLFGLGYEHSARKWALRAVNKDAPVTDTWSYAKVTSTDAPTIGAWTLLTGVYDAEKKEIRLYVNGELQGTAPYLTAWAATGPLQIGRMHWSDTYSDYFKGNVDEPTVWQRALASQEIADLAQPMNSPSRAAVELVADWSAEDGSGTTIPDTDSGYGRSLTLAGGASLDGQEIVLDGVDDAATASGPVVDDTGSFTVTTLASLDGDKIASKPVGYTGQVLGQRTADGSAWGIWYKRTGSTTEFDEEAMEEKTVPEGYWYFGRLNSDGTFSAVASKESALMDGMVRLTGVFNAAEGTVSLYLSSVRNGDPEAFTAKIGSGAFAVGKGSSKGTWQHYLPAHVREARVWAGAMATHEQIDETVTD
ncbi:LamG domain-containing protein [Streptomyces coelicoflavus]|uniref:LamG domain-containing protein n=1 Tax=Streptomyces coelicoflavus TaxID=285562 RepID=UPI00344C776F